jgi:TM2 domain-containing membrane protein YozV
MATPANPTVTTEANVKCPYCAEVIAAEAKKCKHCGEFLDDTLKQARMPSPAVQQPQQSWNPGVAAVLSLVIPGAGQMYKGQIGPGILWLIGTVAGYCAFIIPGLIAHIFCIYKAYSDDPTKANKAKPLAAQPARNTPAAVAQPSVLCSSCGKYTTSRTALCHRCGKPLT